MEASILIPMHNEAASLGSARFLDALAWIRRELPGAELIIIDDGSRDGTAEAARPLADQVVEQPHRGKAFALQAGFAAASADLVLWADADWSVPPAEFLKLLADLRAGADYVMGSRGWGRPGAPLHRWLGSCWFTWRCRSTFGWSYTDTQCGLKGARRAALLQIQAHLLRFSTGQRDRFAGTDAMFDIECLLVARKLGMKIVERRIGWRHEANREPIHYRPLLRQIRQDFRAIRANFQQGRYHPVGQ